MAKNRPPGAMIAGDRQWQPAMTSVRSMNGAWRSDPPGTPGDFTLADRIVAGCVAPYYKSTHDVKSRGHELFLELGSFTRVSKVGIPVRLGHNPNDRLGATSSYLRHSGNSCRLVDTSRGLFARMALLADDSLTLHVLKGIRSGRLRGLSIKFDPEAQHHMQRFGKREEYISFAPGSLIDVSIVDCGAFADAQLVSVRHANVLSRSNGIHSEITKQLHASMDELQRVL